MHDIVASQMSLHVQDGSHSAHVVSSGDVGEVTGLVLVELNNLVLFEVVFDGISLGDFGIGESDGSGVVGDNVGLFVGSDNASLDLEQLELGLSLLQFGEGEPALDVIEQSEALVGLGESDDVHDADGELDITSDPAVDLNAGFFILDDGVCFAAVEGELEVIPAWGTKYLRMIERGRHSLSLWGPWLGLNA